MNHIIYFFCKHVTTNPLNRYRLTHHYIFALAIILLELSDNIDNAIIAIILSYRDMSLNNHDRDNLRMRRQPSARVSFSHLRAAITARCLRPRNFYPWKEPRARFGSKHCGKHVKYNGNTTNLRVHIRDTHSKVYRVRDLL